MRKLLTGVTEWLPNILPKKKKLTKKERKALKAKKREEERLERERRKALRPPAPPRNRRNEQGTLHRLDERLEAYAAPLLDELFPQRARGRKQVNLIRVLNGILYHARTGCSWRLLPMEFGDYRTVHRWFIRLAEASFFRDFWELMLRESEDSQAVDWSWASIDGSFTRGAFGQQKSGPNPTDRGKGGSKRSVMVDGGGYPISIATDAANVHDCHLLKPTLDNAFKPKNYNGLRHLALDAGYDNNISRLALRGSRFVVHLKRIREEGLVKHTIPGDDGEPRRWKVERAHAWSHHFQTIKVRRAKKAVLYDAALELAASLLWYRRLYQAQGWLAQDRMTA
jgi:putative transposase